MKAHIIIAEETTDYTLEYSQHCMQCGWQGGVMDKWYRKLMNELMHAVLSE